MLLPIPEGQAEQAKNRHLELFHSCAMWLAGPNGEERARNDMPWHGWRGSHRLDTAMLSGQEVESSMR